MTKPLPGSWVEMVEPIVNKHRVAHAMGMSVSYNTVGCEAIGKLIHGMAVKLDRAVALDLARPPPPSDSSEWDDILRVFMDDPEKSKKY